MICLLETQTLSFLSSPTSSVNRTLLSLEEVCLTVVLVLGLDAQCPILGGTEFVLGSRLQMTGDASEKPSNRQSNFGSTIETAGQSILISAIQTYISLPDAFI